MNRGRFHVFAFAAVAFAASGTLGAADEKAQVQAVLLDHNEFLCSNCLFGISDYYFCFDAGNRILIGHEKVRTQTWKHSPVELLETGKKLPVRFDDRFIWVTRPDGKESKLTQDYTKKVFVSNERCQAAVKAGD